MLNLILFELKKIFKDIKNLICIIFFLLFIMGFIYINSQIDTNKKMGWKSTLYSQSDSISMKIQALNTRKQSNPSSIDSKTDREITFLSQHQTIISDMIKAYNNKNLKDYLTARKTLDEHSIEGIKSNIDFNNLKSIDFYKLNIEKLDIFINKNITPIFEENCMEGYNFLKLISSNLIMLVIILVLLNFVIECFSSEFEKNTYKLLFIQPISKTKIFFSKFIARLIISFLILTLVIVSFFLLLGITNGFGNLEYPTEMFVNGKLTFVPLREYLSNSLPLLITVLLFIFCFCIFVSCIFNSTSICVSFTILTSVTFLCLCAIVKSIKSFIPFSYIQINDFLCSNDFIFKTPINLLYIMSFNIVLVASSLIILKKKIYKN